MSFENIYKLAQQAMELNEKQYAKKLIDMESNKIQIEEKIKEHREVGFKNVNYETDCYSSKLLNKIKECGFIIESYEKFTNFDEEDYESTLEVYYCSLNNWEFKVNNSSDVDIDQGIWALREIQNKLSGEKIDFYCDLGCQNTSQARLEEALDLFKYDSLEDYMSIKYKKYIILPELLRENGFEVEERDYTFTLNRPKGYLKLGKNLFIKVYSAWMDNFHLVVTNDKGWDVNSGTHSGDVKKAYYFNYNGADDINELVKCINAFKEEQEGKIGYFENGKYYNTYDVQKIFNNLRDKEDYYKESWNERHIQIEYKDYWDGRGYNQDAKIVNKYKGLEIYLETELTFNDAAQWSEGELVNKSLIVFEYDKTKNNNCRLEIINYIYSQYEEYQDYDDNKEEWTIKLDKIQDKIELYGTFLELTKRLKEYIDTMIKIHNISL